VQNVRDDDLDDSGDVEETADVLNPHYYRRGDVEVFDALLSWGFGRDYAIGNIVKYVVRAGHKGAADPDLRKARWYLDKLIELQEGGEDGGEESD
jgi:hypothetical protein